MRVRNPYRWFPRKDEKEDKKDKKGKSDRRSNSPSQVETKVVVCATTACLH